MEASGAVWRTSSHSTQDGNCVEVAVALPGRIAVRDSKAPAGPELTYTPQVWMAFTSRAKRSRADMA
jgi:hypothetical protein